MTTKIFAFLIASFISVSLFSQNGKYGATPEDSIKCIENLSIYMEPYFKNKNYKEAVKYWRVAFNTCPKSSKNMYINGVKMYKTFIKEEADPIKKEALIDTLMLIYDQRIVNYGEEGKVKGRQGSDLLKLRKAHPEQGNAILKESFDIQGNKMEPGALVYYYQSIRKMVIKKQVEKVALIEAFPAVMAVAEYNIANAKKEKTKVAYQKTKANIEKMFLSAAKCGDLIDFYTPKFEATPNDTILLQNIVKFLAKYDKSGCTDEALYEKAASNLCAVSPSYDCALALGQMSSKKKDFKTALEYFKTAAENATTDENKITAYTKAAQCSYNLKQYSNVRMYSRKVIAINPNLGEPYILIGDVYGASSASCGDNDCNKKAGYWAAIDKYAKAKAVDPSVTEKANKRIASAAAQAPKKADCFFYSINAGDAYTVGGWINEKTTVRCSD